jgi:hypothetical protein
MQPKGEAEITFNPVFIGFLPPSGAIGVHPPLTLTQVRRPCTQWDDAAHILGRPDSVVPNCVDRHNFATRRSPLSVG